jgi:MoaA/NifB/PqqE/SkfB family radical SAM enzyme
MPAAALDACRKNDIVPARGDERLSALESPIVTGWRSWLVTARLWASVLRLALARYSSRRAIRIVVTLFKTVRAAWPDTGSGLAPKLVRGAGRYFFHLNYPGFPSRAFDCFVDRELARVASSPEPSRSLQTLILAITRRCPLSCEHCSEWKTLNQRERLSTEDLLAIAKRFEALGVTQVILSGGEPMLRLDDIVKLCRASHPETDYWIATSGHRLDRAAAEQLAQAGLTGVLISMDHFEAGGHDAFRGRAGSFHRVRQAARNVREAGLVLCLTLCATRDFTSARNLERYARLAGELGAGFIQVLEPRAVGRYEGLDVALSPEQLGLLDEFKMKMNTDRGWVRLPAVVYHGYYQRRLGCYGAGRRFVFVNSAAEVHACPFCPASAGSCLDGPLDEVLKRVERLGCHAYPLAR